MTSGFTVKDVLRFLDGCIAGQPYWFFMDLQHGYFYTANSRLTLYADEYRWAIVFEKNGYANRALEIQLELNFFGNCLGNLDRAGSNGQFISNAKLIRLVPEGDLRKIETGFEQVSHNAASVLVRGQPVPVPLTKEGYAKWVPDIHEGAPSRPDFKDLARYLAFEYADLCRATDAEKRQCLPADLPALMTVDAWHHRHYAGDYGVVMGEPPSSYETFPLLAEALVTRDPSRYRPTLAPNNHWSNWPEAGSL